MMIRIWEGNITKIWDAVQFCRLIDNLFFWARHCLKPKITQYLSQWRLRYCPDTPNTNSRLEKDIKTADIVYRIQDRLSSLGIAPNEDIQALVQQAVILQEVWGTTNENDKLNPKADDEMKNAEAASVLKHPKGRFAEVTLSHQKQSEKGIEQRVGPKSQEERGQNGGSTSETNVQSTTQSSRPHNDLVVQPDSSSKCETTVVIVPEKSGLSSKEEQTAAEEPRGQYSMKFSF
jgi:hypothetical protein